MACHWITSSTFTTCLSSHASPHPLAHLPAPRMWLELWHMHILLMSVWCAAVAIERTTCVYASVYRHIQLHVALYCRKRIVWKTLFSISAHICSKQINKKRIMRTLCESYRKNWTENGTVLGMKSFIRKQQQQQLCAILVLIDLVSSWRNAATGNQCCGKSSPTNWKTKIFWSCFCRWSVCLQTPQLLKYRNMRFLWSWLKHITIL